MRMLEKRPYFPLIGKAQILQHESANSVEQLEYYIEAGPPAAEHTVALDKHTKDLERSIEDFVMYTDLQAGSEKH